MLHGQMEKNNRKFINKKMIAAHLLALMLAFVSITYAVHVRIQTAEQSILLNSR